MGEPGPVPVTLVTQADCQLCEQAKAVLERLSATHAIEVSVHDLASPEGESLARQGGVLFPPGIFVGGEPFSYGRLSERKLRRELDRRGAARVDG